jgi:hypothetical protein
MSTVAQNTNMTYMEKMLPEQIKYSGDMYIYTHTHTEKRAERCCSQTINPDTGREVFVYDSRADHKRNY